MTMPGQRLGAPERKGLAGFESAPTECLLPGAANSVKAACSWNLSLRSKPSSVVGVANNSDMQAAFRLAAARDLPVGVDRAGRGAVAPIGDEADRRLVALVREADPDGRVRFGHVVGGNESLQWLQCTAACRARADISTFATL